MATAFLPTPFFPLLCQVAPRLSRRFFSCSQRHQTHGRIRQLSKPSNAFRSTGETPFLKAFRSGASSRGSDVTSQQQRLSSSTIQPSPTPAAGQVSIEGKEHAEHSSGSAGSGVAYWLIGSAASVFGLVVFGGLTRLTESGLSITEWRPVTGTLPPFGNDAWEAEFSRYKASPEYAQINPRMTLSEFKKIYWMEYTHRVWGRVVFFSFFFPTVYLIARKRVTPKLGRNLLLINALIVSQGFVGWWMVKSGLKDDLFAKGTHPRVSQYRLTVHLGLAFIVYLSMLWNGMSVLRDTGSRRFSQALPIEKLRRFRYGTLALASLVFTTAMSGALVAGLDAGLIYNEFPNMGLGLVPPKSELLDPFYSRQSAPHNDLVWRNMFENPTFVQLDHRILAVTTFTAVHALWAYARFSPSIWTALPLPAKRLVHGVVGLVWMQAALGLTTLLYFVPLPAASAHQAGSMALLTGVLAVAHRLSPRQAQAVKGAAKQLQQSRVAGTNFGKTFKTSGGGANGIPSASH